jgi:hypothetical protein
VSTCAEGADDLEDFDPGQHDAVSGPVLVSLFRDLLAANEQSALGVEAV